MSNQETQSTPPISESLLALAKDARYLQACRELVHQVLASFSLGHINTNNTNSDNNVVLLEASLLSTILYTVLVIARKRKSFGMEVTGLKYADDVSRWKIVVVSLLTALLSFAIARLAQLHNNDDDNDTNNSNASTESLRGQKRRDYFEAQRRAMMERARDKKSSNNPSGVASGATAVNMRSGSTAIQNRNFVKKFRSFARATIRRLSSALDTRMEGPHTIEDQNGGSESSNFTLSAQTMASWLFRLHLAFYCLNGRYATLSHRLLLGSSFQTETPDRLVHQPPTVRIAGLMILAQALGVTARVLARALVRSWIQFTETTLPASASQPGPSIDFGFATNSNSNTSIPLARQSESICGICHQARTYPACPVGCGHVFCWTCLQQWSTTVRPECPLCRTSCTSRDILPLYNYYP